VQKISCHEVLTA